MHLVQEQEEPGKTKYRVYTKNGALIYVGHHAGAAQEMYENGEREELDVRKTREARSSGSSD